MILFMTIQTKPRFLIKTNSEQSNVNVENKALPTDDSSPNHCLVILYQVKYHSQVKI
jgi:hypothetical protein